MYAQYPAAYGLVDLFIHGRIGGIVKSTSRQDFRPYVVAEIPCDGRWPSRQSQWSADLRRSWQRTLVGKDGDCAKLDLGSIRRTLRFSLFSLHRLRVFRQDRF